MSMGGPGADAQKLAEAAAMAALGSIDTAQQYGAPSPATAPSFAGNPYDAGFGMGGMPGMPGMGSMPGMYAPPGYEAAASPEKAPTGKDIKSLEDLYALFPQIGDGGHYLRVERLMPKTFMGSSVAGYLDDLHEKPSLEEFRERYGGTKYMLTVFGPRGMTPEGQPLIRRLHSLEVIIPGPPALGTYPRAEDAMTQRMMGGMGGMMGGMGGMGGPRMGMPGSVPFGGVYQSGEPVEIALKRLEFEEKERERREKEKQFLMHQSNANSRPPDMYMDAMRGASERNIEHVRILSQQQIDHLSKQTEELQKELRGREADLDRARQQIVEARREAAEALRYHETEQMAALKTRFEQEMRQAEAAHTKTIERLSQDHREAIANQAKQTQDDRGRLIESETRERSRAYEDMKNRVDTVRDDSERRAAQIKDTYEARIADLQRQLERETSALKEANMREVSSLKDTHSRELHAAKLTEETKSALSRETSGLHVNTANERLTRMEAELVGLRRENVELREKAHKDPLTLLRETKEIAADMLGMIDSRDADKAVDPANDWKSMLGRAAGSLMEKAPAIAQSIAAAQQGKAAQAQQVVQQQTMQAQQAQAQAYARQMGGPVYQPPQLTGQPGPGAQPMKKRRLGNRPPGAFAPPPWAISDRSSAAPVASPLQPDAEAPAMPNGQPPAGAPQQGMPAGINEAMINEFLSEMANAVSGGLVPSSLFARGVVDRLGAETARHLLTNLSADDLLEALDTNGGPPPLLNMDGRTYVREVYAEVGKLVKLA